MFYERAGDEGLSPAYWFTGLCYRFYHLYFDLRTTGWIAVACASEVPCIAGLFLTFFFALCELLCQTYQSLDGFQLLHFWTEIVFRKYQRTRSDPLFTCSTLPTGWLICWKRYDPAIIMSPNLLDCRSGWFRTQRFFEKILRQIREGSNLFCHPSYIHATAQTWRIWASRSRLAWRMIHGTRKCFTSIILAIACVWCFAMCTGTKLPLILSTMVSSKSFAVLENSQPATKSTLKKC